MEALMREDTHSPLGFGSAFARQLKLLWTSRRPLLLAVALLALLVLAGDPWSSDPKTRLLTFWPIWLVVVGPVWGFAVFHGEGPANRLYHWSLPVGRTEHTLARLAAGVTWLWITYLVLILGGVIMGATDGDLWQLGEVSVAGWVNLFTGPLMGYLAASLLTIHSDYPLRWFFGLIFAIPLTLSVLNDWLGLRTLADALLEPLVSAWGFFPVLVGGLGHSVAQLDNQIHSLSRGGATDPGLPDLGLWWTAMPVWVLLLLGLMVFLASRHPDTLPRLRRSG